MPTPPTQSYANHVRVPALLLAIQIPLALNAGVQVWVAITSGGGVLAWWGVVSALALAALPLAARGMSLIAQDRIIRLEMRLRLALLMPGRDAELARLSVPQLIGLRFAADTELPGLIDQVLKGELATQDAIKRAVKDWQPDHLRV